MEKYTQKDLEKAVRVLAKEMGVEDAFICYQNSNTDMITQANAIVTFMFMNNYSKKFMKRKHKKSVKLIDKFLKDMFNKGTVTVSMC